MHAFAFANHLATKQARLRRPANRTSQRQPLWHPAPV